MLGTRKPRDTVLISFAHRRGTARYCIEISSDESRNNSKSDRSHGSNYDIMTTQTTKRRMELNLRTSKEVEKTVGVVEICGLDTIWVVALLHSRIRRRRGDLRSESPSNEC